MVQYNKRCEYKARTHQAICRVYHNPTTCSWSRNITLSQPCHLPMVKGYNSVSTFPPACDQGVSQYLILATCPWSRNITISQPSHLPSLRDEQSNVGSSVTASAPDSQHVSYYHNYNNNQGYHKCDLTCPKIYKYANNTGPYSF